MAGLEPTCQNRTALSSRPRSQGINAFPNNRYVYPFITFLFGGSERSWTSFYGFSVRRINHFCHWSINEGFTETLQPYWRWLYFSPIIDFGGRPLSITLLVSYITFTETWDHLLMADLCGWKDSNLHAFQHKILNLACLPISPHPQFHGKRSWTFLTICQFFICISVRNSWLAVSSPILNNTFLAVTLPLLTSFIINTSAVLGWCSFLRDASKQRVSSFTTSDTI